MTDATTTELTLVPSTPTPEPPASLAPASESEHTQAAIKRCCSAWRRAYNAYMQGKEGDDVDRMFAAKEASEVYCNAMPVLSTRENIRAFIACAAHGVLIGAIPSRKSSSLLYAAQVALSALNPAPLRR
jgi:hypothetical protein